MTHLSLKQVAQGTRGVTHEDWTCPQPPPLKPKPKADATQGPPVKRALKPIVYKEHVSCQFPFNSNIYLEMKDQKTWSPLTPVYKQSLQKRWEELRSLFIQLRVEAVDKTAVKSTQKTEKLSTKDVLKEMYKLYILSPEIMAGDAGLDGTIKAHFDKIEREIYAYFEQNISNLSLTVPLTMPPHLQDYYKLGVSPTLQTRLIDLKIMKSKEVYTECRSSSAMLRGDSYFERQYKDYLAVCDKSQAEFFERQAPKVPVRRLFHATSIENAVAILEHGSFQQGHRNLYGDGIYFAPHPHSVMIYGDQKTQDPSVTICIFEVMIAENHSEVVTPKGLSDPYHIVKAKDAGGINIVGAYLLSSSKESAVSVLQTLGIMKVIDGHTSVTESES